MKTHGVPKPATTPLATILVVDDTPLNLTLITRALESDYHVVSASSGAAALVSVAQHLPDIILLDVMMPDMDGFAVAEALGQDAKLRHIPIIFLTALSDQQSQIRGLELGAVDFLTKPVVLKILRKRVANVIERERLRTDAVENQALMRELLIKQTEAHNTLESAFNASNDALIVTNQDFRILRTNANVAALFACEPEALNGSSFLNFRFQSHNQAPCLASELIGLERPYECTVDSVQGVRRWVAVTGRSFHAGTGAVHYLFTLRDISERLHAEQELAGARQRELDIGASIQKRLLFGPPPPDLKGVSVACFSEASQGVDGDFYTFTKLSAYCFEVLTGDVMGKGVAAALIAAGVINTYHKVFSELLTQQKDGSVPSPADLINGVHLAMTPELIELQSFVTLALIRVDAQAQTVTWVNAGHTPTLVARSDGQKILELLGNNLPLGVIEEEVYQEQLTRVDIGDTLLLYSDGISESVDASNTEYGVQRIINIMALGQQNQSHPSMTLNSLRGDVHNYTQYQLGADDRTAVLIQLHPLRGTRRGNITERRCREYLNLPRHLDQLKPLRERIAAAAIDQPEEFVQTLTLAAFEAATNVIRHTPNNLKEAPLTVALTRTSTSLCVDLIYEGQTFMPPGAPCPDFSGNSDGGFGLFIIENSVDTVEYGTPMPNMASISLTKHFPIADDSARPVL